MSEYPDENILKRIETWDGEDVELMLTWIYESWNQYYGDITCDRHTTGVKRLILITGGWSGNEDVMSAIYKNRLFDGLYWQRSERGGLHVYEVSQ